MRDQLVILKVTHDARDAKEWDWMTLLDGAADQVEAVASIDLAASAPYGDSFFVCWPTASGPTFEIISGRDAADEFIEGLVARGVDEESIVLFDGAHAEV